MGNLAKIPFSDSQLTAFNPFFAKNMTCFFLIKGNKNIN
jgi:hypothetical protein